MLDLNRTPHTEEIYKQLTDAGHSYMRDESAKCRRNECDINGLHVGALPAGMQDDAQSALADLREFCQKALHCPWNGTGVLLTIVINGRKEGKEPDGYSFDVTVSSIVISAITSRGVARALYRLQNLLRLRRAPFLTLGHYDSSHAMKCALAYIAFKRSVTNDMDYPEAYDENYLRRIARAGYTGFHVNFDADLFFKSKILPELNNPQALENRETLRQIVLRAAHCGLDVYLTPYLIPLPSDHPVFVKHPETRGSRLVCSTSHVLCTSSAKILAFCDEQFRSLFRDIPELGGAIFISGCEGWLHCYTACDESDNNGCQCQDKSPEEAVATMFNVIGRAIKETVPSARCIIWNYGIYAWSSIGAEKFISHLSADCDVMANFDTGEDYTLEGAHGTYFDYSLSCVGPSKPCIIQYEHALRGHHRFLVKCESGTSLEYCSLQYSPTVQRWYRKFANIQKLGVDGVLFNWKFVGYTGGLSQELAGLMASGEVDDILDRLAVREFGQDNLSIVRNGWKWLDKAVDFHPFSINSAGYFKGPFYIGPAQPLVLDAECPPKLPDCFYFTTKSRTPMIMTTLRFVEPFGVKAFRRSLIKLSRYWERGCNYLNCMNPHREDAYLNSRIESHQALCRLFMTFFRTAIHMIDFFELRDSFHYAPYSPEEAKAKLLKMADIAKAELDNTQQALTIVKKFPMLSYSYTYHYGISAEMCEFKIAHTKDLLKNALPLLYYGMTFTRNRHPELLRLDVRDYEYPRNP